jgi:hypothetical protein
MYAWLDSCCSTAQQMCLCVLVLCTQVNMMFVMLLWGCIHTGQAEKYHILEYTDIEGTRLSSEISSSLPGVDARSE